MNVEDVMVREVVTVPPGASLKEAARLLVEHRISGLPVVDNRQHVIGVVSEADVLSKEVGDVPASGSLSWLPGFAAEADRSKLEARLVGDAMTSPAVTIEAHRPLIVAARRMIERGVNRLPVVSDGKLVGIVTRADLVGAFVRSDAVIAAEIRDLLVRDLQLDGGRIRVEVEDGEVTLTGTLDNRGDAQPLQALVARVPGVVGLDSRLVWTDDDGEC